MKRFSLSREGALKGFLFLALVGNLTWEPLANHFSEVQLSSTQTADRDRRCADNDTACKAATRDQRGAIVAEAERIRKATQGKTTAAPDVSSRTEAAATESCKDCEKTANDKKIEKLKAQAAELEAEAAKLAGTTSTETDDEEVDAVSAERLAQQRANCEINTDGDKLSEMAELKCLTKLLSTLKGRETASRRKEVTRKIEDLFTHLKKDAKADVLSKDADRRNKGERQITDLMTALNSVRFDKDSTRTDMIDSLEALRAGAEARVAAADLEEDVADLETEMKGSWKDLNKLTREFQNSCRTRTGCDRDVYEQIQDQNARINELKEEHYELAQLIKEEQDEAVDTLEDHSDAMTRSELRDYTSPFAKLKSRMETMVDARKLGASSEGNKTGVDAIPGQDSRYNGSGQAFLEENGLPADFYEVRGGNTALRRGNGMYQIPGNSQVPMGSAQNVNTQMMQQQYSPQYMQIPGQQGYGQSLLPAPGGMAMNPMMGTSPMMPVGMNPMMAGQNPMMGGQQVLPVPGQQQYGQPMMGGSQQVLPVPR